MHDPKSVAFQIYFGKKEKKNRDYKKPLITIWHCDPEKDGTDDSCGWFIRDRHCNKIKLEKIKKEFNFNFKHNYWFDKDGKQIFSTIGTLVDMYKTAAFIHFDYNRKKTNNFIRKYCSDIISFSENSFDCAGDYITGKYYKDNLLKEDRFSGIAGMIYMI